ncbi:MAG: LytR C-terminal domain-containing protein [Aeromicrobium sp.]
MADEPRPGGGWVVLAGLVLVVGMFVGWKLLTGSSGSDDGGGYTCKTQTVRAGQPLSSSVVTVDVYNGSDQEGLAGRVSAALQERGFRQGAIANSPSATKPNAVTILTENQSDPRVQLVAQQFSDVDFRVPDFGTSASVTVVVGDGFTGLKDGAPATITAASDVSLCY